MPGGSRPRGGWVWQDCRNSHPLEWRGSYSSGNERETIFTKFHQINVTNLETGKRLVKVNEICTLKVVTLKFACS